MPHKDPVYAAFYRARRDATLSRGIEWQLTFEEWRDIWEASGHLHERGCRKGQYCMARHGDIGPYAVGNVSIILTTDNTLEGWNNHYTISRKQNMRKKHAMSEEGQRILSDKLKGNSLRLGTKNKWINNGSKTRMIPRDDPIPEGWQAGRLMSWAGKAGRARQASRKEQVYS